MTSDSGEWLTVKDAAEKSGYDQEHIRRLIRNGEITGRKFSIVWMVNSTSLLEYIKTAKALGKKRGPKSGK